MSDPGFNSDYILSVYEELNSLNWNTEELCREDDGLEENIPDENNEQ